MIKHYDEIVNSSWKDDFNPRYVEVSFSNACNFKCSYCSPQFSTKWMEEIQEHGAYPTTDKFNGIDYLIEENNGMDFLFVCFLLLVRLS